jgi:hypothetical protein
VVEALDLLSHKWGAQINRVCEIGDISRRPSYRPQDFGLQSLYDLDMGRLDAAPELNAIRLFRFEHALIQEQLVGERELRLTPQKPVQATRLKIEVEAF